MPTLVHDRYIASVNASMPWMIENSKVKILEALPIIFYFPSSELTRYNLEFSSSRILIRVGKENLLEATRVPGRSSCLNFVSSF